MEVNCVSVKIEPASNPGGIIGNRESSMKREDAGEINFNVNVIAIFIGQ